MTTTRVVHVNSAEWAEAVATGTAVYIGRAVPRRGFEASKWANPYRVGKNWFTRDGAIDGYRRHLIRREDLIAALPELRGKVLGCWCKKQGDEPCHGDLLALAADLTWYESPATLVTRA